MCALATFSTWSCFTFAPKAIHVQICNRCLVCALLLKIQFGSLLASVWFCVCIEGDVTAEMVDWQSMRKSTSKVLEPITVDTEDAEKFGCMACIVYWFGTRWFLGLHHWLLLNLLQESLILALWHARWHFPDNPNAHVYLCSDVFLRFSYRCWANDVFFWYLRNTCLQQL